MTHKEKQYMVRQWLTNQISAWKISSKELPYSEFGYCVGIVDAERGKEINIYGVQKLAGILDIEVQREDWSGNKTCNSNHDMIWFIFKGFKFWQLTEKENTNEGQ